MTAAAVLGWALWAAVIVSMLGVMAGGGILALRTCTCGDDTRGLRLLLGSLLLGVLAGSANYAVSRGWLL